jgi:nitrile hydratase accessory protein
MPSTSICGTTILNQPDAVQGPPKLPTLAHLPRDTGGPVFAEPWQAQAFALAVTLSDQGYFTWKEWAGELAATLRAAADRGERDDGSRYYDYWLATLERMVMAKGLTTRRRSSSARTRGPRRTETLRTARPSCSLNRIRN